MLRKSLSSGVALVATMSAPTNAVPALWRPPQQIVVQFEQPLAVKLLPQDK